ncbi:MAG: polysaccharide biosynthesis protein, partial [Tissierellia bacterium]|nr:polysaccharide biosynthesis protein [Tissierellia bacterium]
MKQKLKSGLFVFSDIVLLTISFVAAYVIRFDFDFDAIPGIYVNRMLLLLGISLILKIAVFIPFKLYKSLWKYAGIYELVSIFLASALTNGAIFVYIAFVDRLAPRSIFVITGMLDVILIGGSRLMYRLYRRLVLGRVIKMDNLRRVLIVGAGDAGAMIAKEMELHPELNYRPVAFLDDNDFKKGKKVNGIPVLGGIEDVADVVDRKSINEIIIAIPSAKTSVINKIYEQCVKTKCKVKILPSMSQLIDETIM